MRASGKAKDEKGGSSCEDKMQLQNVVDRSVCR